MNTTLTRPEPGPRLFFIDWLRILAFGLLIPYHVGMYYVSWDWHVKNPVSHAWLEPVMQLSSPWRMGLLFLVGGVASAALLRKKGRAAFARSRSQRLLWPLVFGMLVVVPPQAYFEVVTKVQYAGSYLDFMGLYLQAYHGFCRGTDCLTLPTWNHLWFLPYLWCYSMLALALPQGGRGLGDRLDARLRSPQAWRWLLALALPLMAARLLIGSFPPKNNLTWDWYNHAQYGWLFVLGLLAGRADHALWAEAERRRWAFTLLALFSWLLIQAYFQHYADVDPPERLRQAQRLLYGLMQWACLVAVLGHGRHHLSVDSPWRVRLGAAVFCAYVLHQTLIVLLTQLLAPLRLPDGVEALLLIALTALGCAIGYGVLRHIPGLRVCVGIAPRAASAPAQQGLLRQDTMSNPLKPGADSA